MSSVNSLDEKELPKPAWPFPTAPTKPDEDKKDGQSK